MATTERGKSFCLRADVVAQSLALLRSQNIHPVFAGYLCLKRIARKDWLKQGQAALSPNFKEFFDTYFLVAGAPPRKPYVMPFVEGTANAKNEWFNRNVAGSYARSSLRDVSPYRKVVAIADAKGKPSYKLLPGHAQLALKYLTFSKKIPAAHLAAFLYRDFGFTTGMTVPLLVDVFRHEFGYRHSDEEENKEFDVIYDAIPQVAKESEWFEPHA
jgi:hypothetical protein